MNLAPAHIKKSSRVCRGDDRSFIQIHLGLIFLFLQPLIFLHFLLVISQRYSLPLIVSLKYIYVVVFFGGREHSRFHNHKNWVKRFMRSLRKTLFHLFLTASSVLFLWYVPIILIYYPCCFYFETEKRYCINSRIAYTAVHGNKRLVQFFFLRCETTQELLYNVIAGLIFCSLCPNNTMILLSSKIGY